MANTTAQIWRTGYLNWTEQTESTEVSIHQIGQGKRRADWGPVLSQWKLEIVETEGGPLVLSLKSTMGSERDPRPPCVVQVPAQFPFCPITPTSDRTINGCI